MCIKHNNIKRCVWNIKRAARTWHNVVLCTIILRERCLKELPVCACGLTRVTSHGRHTCHTLTHHIRTMFYGTTDQERRLDYHWFLSRRPGRREQWTEISSTCVRTVVITAVSRCRLPVSHRVHRYFSSPYALVRSARVDLSTFLLSPCVPVCRRKHR